VNKNDLGAGDQGVMYGYATNKTPQAMPLSIVLAHDLIAKATYLIDSKKFKHAKYDMKSEVTID
jgi:S-adenosylmethionine synthetase